MDTHGEMIIYQTEDGLTKIDVNMQDETVWLSLEQMSDLFQRDKSTISRHIKNIFDEGELERTSTVAKFATVQNEGNRQVERAIEYYNLDVIISVGYRVKSQRGVQFRIWAAGILKEYIKKGFAMDGDRLKELGGGGYFKELLERIRDIRASEKDFMGLMSFSGEQPTLRETKIAKNYLFVIYNNDVEKGVEKLWPIFTVIK